MMTYPFNRKPKTSRRCTKPPTILQKIAREHNWYKWFVLKQLNVEGLHVLKLSPHTQACIAQANKFIYEAKRGITADWKEQREELKQQQKRKE